MVYIKLYMARRRFKKRWMRAIHEGVVRGAAGLKYLIACAMVLICVPFFVINLVVQELQLWGAEPDFESAYQVGQWSPWSYTVLVILAALIARYRDRIYGAIARVGLSLFGCQPGHRDHEPEHGTRLVTDQHHSNSPHQDPLPSPPSSLSYSDSNPIQPYGFLQTLAQLYAACFQPFSQTGTAPVDEFRNFILWCKNPQEVSRLVVRHPNRHNEEEYIDARPAVVDAVNGDLRGRGLRLGA
ncbi:hypothetical protein ACLMJK_008424 [Lecanora helva]